MGFSDESQAAYRRRTEYEIQAAYARLAGDDELAAAYARLAAHEKLLLDILYQPGSTTSLTIQGLAAADLSLLSLLRQLSELWLQDCPGLTDSDLSVLPQGAPHLSSLYIQGCPLEHPDFSGLPNLTRLRIDFCPMLRRLTIPPTVRWLVITHCPLLLELSAPSAMTEVTRLHIAEAKRTSRTRLDITLRPVLTELAVTSPMAEVTICNCGITGIPASWSGLQELWIEECPSFEALPALPNLARLRLGHCPNLKGAAPTGAWTYDCPLLRAAA